MASDKSGEFAAIAQSIAPVGCMMVAYCIFYYILLGLATSMSWLGLFALAGQAQQASIAITLSARWAGGAIATAIFGWYLIYNMG